jgi:hypothetical protein
MVSRSSGKRSIRKSIKQAKKRSPFKQPRKKSAKLGAAGASELSVAAADEDDALSPRQKLIRERAIAAARKETTSFLVTTSLICGFLGALVALLTEPKLGVAVGGALMCLIVSFRYQREALYAFIIYVPFSGTVTYALGGNQVLQVAKDIFYIPALIGVYQFCRKNRLPIILPRALKGPLIFLVIMVSMTALFTNVPDQFLGGGGAPLADELTGGKDKLPLVMAIWGAKLLLGYVPLVACIYYLIRTTDDLINLLRLQAVLVLTACSLGMIQYLMLKTGICKGTTGVGEEMFRASLEARCFVGGSLLYSPDVGQIRLPGTFVAPWQWGWFLISGAFFSFGTTFSDRSPFWRLVGLVSLVTVMIMAVVSGQRIALVLVPFFLLLLTVLTGQVANLKRFVPIGVVLAIILAYLMASNPAVVQARVDSLASRWEASPPQQFILEQFGQVWKDQEGIFGHGVGRATNSARSFGRTTLIETYHPKLIYEIGPIGLFATLLVYTTLTVVTFKVYRNTTDKNLRSYAAAMWVFVAFISYCPYYYPLDVDPVGVYYWLAAGIVLKIPELERQERVKAEEAALAAAALAEGTLPEEAPPKRGGKKGSRDQPSFT